MKLKYIICALVYPTWNNKSFIWATVNCENAWPINTSSDYADSWQIETSKPNSTTSFICKYISLTKDAQSIIQGYHNHMAIAGEHTAIVGVTSAKFETLSVYENHHRVRGLQTSIAWNWTRLISLVDFGTILTMFEPTNSIGNGKVPD